MDALRAEEIRVFEELRAEGVIQDAYRLLPGPGVVIIIEAAGLDEARAPIKAVQALAGQNPMDGGGGQARDGPSGRVRPASVGRPTTKTHRHRG